MKKNEIKEKKKIRITDDDMLPEYDFSNAIKNPFAKHQKIQITINLNKRAVDYFKMQAVESGIPYQTLMNMYLTDCADKERKPHMIWE